MVERVDPAIEAGGEALEDEICRLTESLATAVTPKSQVSRISRRAARRMLDSWPLALALLGTLAVLTGLNLSGNSLGGHRSPRVSAAEQHQRLETLARFAAVEARKFCRQRGRLPTSPVEVGLSSRDNVSFVSVPGDEVMAIARSEQLEVRFDSRGGVVAGGGSRE